MTKEQWTDGGRKMPDKKMLAEPIDCPRCFAQCIRQTRAGVDIDICPKCYGIWLDKKELVKLIHNPSMHDKLTRYAIIESKSKLVCPRCGSLMNLENADKVQVDVCIECKGIWLDAGEMEELKAKEKERFDSYDAQREATLHKVQAGSRKEFLNGIIGRFRR